MSVPDFVNDKKNPRPRSFLKFLLRAKTGWRYPETLDQLYKLAASDKFKGIKNLPTNRGRASKAKWPAMEEQLYSDIEARRARKAKVSSFWIKRQALQALFSSSNKALYHVYLCSSMLHTQASGPVESLWTAGGRGLHVRNLDPV